MVTRRRREEKIDLPDYFEGVPFKAPLRVVGWVVLPSATALGIALMVWAQGTLLEVLGAVSAASGCIALTGLVRCRRFETAVGKRWLTAGAGPLNQRVPVDMVDGVEIRPAAAWRRLYADREVAVRLRARERRLTLPSLDPEDTAEAVKHAAARPATGDSPQRK